MAGQVYDAPEQIEVVTLPVVVGVHSPIAKSPNPVIPVAVAAVSFGVPETVLLDQVAPSYKRIV